MSIMSQTFYPVSISEKIGFSAGESMMQTG